MAPMPAVCARDYRDFTFDVVSPELPCGAGWLANCLLELNIPVWQPWGFEVNNEWQRLAPFHYQYKAKCEPWKQTLPALQHLREYQFSSESAACFRHQWPLAFGKRRPLVFFVRDPRDALYSHWRRAIHNDPGFYLSFEAFVHSPYYHYPITFREYQLRFLQIWRSYLSKSDHLIVRFEDYKADARQTLCRVLDFLKIKAGEDQVDQALACSDFSVLKRVEDQLEKQGLLERKFNYAGMAFEYQQSYTPMMHQCVGSDFDDIYQWLGYASYVDARSQSCDFQSGDHRISAMMDVFDPPGNPQGGDRRKQGGQYQRRGPCRHAIQGSAK